METSEAEASLQLELEELLNKEEIRWRDKVKAKWIEEGDNTNAKFFHLSIIVHGRQNVIHYIQNAGNSWVSDRLSIGESFVNYYKALFFVGILNNRYSLVV